VEFSDKPIVGLLVAGVLCLIFSVAFFLMPHKTAEREGFFSMRLKEKSEPSKPKQEAPSEKEENHHDVCEELKFLSERGEELLRRLRGQKGAEPFGGVGRITVRSALAITTLEWLGNVAAFVVREASKSDYASAIVQTPPAGLDGLITSVQVDLKVL